MFKNLSSGMSGSGIQNDFGIPAAITDIGCEREINEDRYAVIETHLGKTWVVCDGMGGEVGGELAAQLAIDAIRRSLESDQSNSPVEALRAAIEEANRVIVLRRQNPAFSSMGTTVVSIMITEQEIAIVHAGDSRAYLVRDGELEQLTVDHTYVQDLVDRGLISQEEALSHPQAHVLTRCLGAEPRLELDSQTLWLWPVDASLTGDRIVLLSDGLYSLVSDDEISEVISSCSPQESCSRLVELAKQRGGYDNITLVDIPLKGELREDSPAQPVRTKTRSQKRSELLPKTSAPLPLGKRLLAMVLLAFLGGVLMALIFLLKFL